MSEHGNTWEQRQVYVTGNESGRRRYLMVSTRLEFEAAKALDELAWDERKSRSQIVDEVLVAYLKDRFPDRKIVTMEDARYGDRSEPRLLGHDELGWRRGARTDVRPSHPLETSGEWGG